MIISRAEVASAVSAYRAVKRKSTAAVAGSNTADSFERSEAAASLSSLLTSSPEPFYRHSLVDELGRQISEGRYFVPTDQIVEKMLGRLIVEAAVAA
jgi:anti-sigma28 factor (negative regulator of flagellin synthesis)